MLNSRYSLSEGARQAAAVSKWTLFFAAAFPIVFLFATMQMSAITVPFWDHWNEVESIKTYYDQGLLPAIWNIVVGLTSPFRPVVPRLIFLFNAILTRWSIASEYIYMYVAMALALLTHYRLIRKLAGTASLTVKEAALFSIVSIFYCSPAKHNIHWWSFMLVLNLSDLFALLTLSLIALNPRKWLTNVAAAALCWLSAYTFTNGLFLILVVAGISQIASARPLRPGRTTAFWTLNTALLYWTYFPIGELGTPRHPALTDLLLFTLMFIGNPVAALIHFSFPNQWEPATGTSLSIICGVVITLGYVAILIIRREYFRNPPPHFLILIGFGLFALLSAGATGWGRAALDQYGIRNGNNSRYVMTGTYIVFGMLYFMFSEGEKVFGRIPSAWMARFSPRSKALAGICAFALFFALSARSYAASVKIYQEARDFSLKISRGFPPDASPTSVDQYLWWNREKVTNLRRDLLRLRIGPYREMYGNNVDQPATQTLGQ